jgi:hypothetical protein
MGGLSGYVTTMTPGVPEFIAVKIIIIVVAFVHLISFMYQRTRSAEINIKIQYANGIYIEAARLSRRLSGCQGFVNLL